MGVLHELFIAIKLKNDTGKGNVDIVGGAKKTGKDVEQAWKTSMDRSSDVVDRTMRKISKKLDPATFIAGTIGGFVGGATYGIFNSILGFFTSLPQKLINFASESAQLSRPMSKALEAIFGGKDADGNKILGTIDRIKQEFTILTDALVGPILAANRVLSEYLDRLGTWWRYLRGMIEYFGEWASRILGVNDLLEDLGGLFDWVLEMGVKQLNVIFNVLSALFTIAEAVAKAIGGSLGGAFDSLAGAFEWFLNMLIRASEYVLVFVGIITDSSHGIGEKISDVAKFILGKIIDLVQLAIPVWQDFCKGLLDLAFEAAEGIANAFIDGINGAINGMIEGINKFINWVKGIKIEIPAIKNPLTGEVIAGGSSVGLGASLGTIGTNPIGRVDFSGMADQFANSSLLSGQDLINRLEDMQKKYGLDVTLEDLAKKYNVDLNAFNKLNLNWSKDLKETIKNLKDSIETKDMKSQVTVYLHQSFTSAVDEAGAKQAGRAAQDALIDELKRQGFGS